MTSDDEKWTLNLIKYTICYELTNEAFILNIYHCFGITHVVINLATLASNIREEQFENLLGSCF